MRSAGRAFSTFTNAGYSILRRARKNSRSFTDGPSGSLEEPPHVLVHHPPPVRPVVAAVGAPVVHGMRDALAGEDLREPIGGPAVLPGTVAGGEMDVRLPEVVV